MSDVVVLTPRAEPELPLEAGCVRPDDFARLGEAEIARLPVWHGNRSLALGDFFDVHGGNSADVRVAGDAGRVRELGARMAGGTLRVEGAAGRYAGAQMSGGTLTVAGAASEFAGAGMSGGVLDIGGGAGAHLGGACAGGARGMTGGTILVRGGAGDFVGERMRRGFIAVQGDVGDCAGLGMIAGTILALGNVGRRPGLGMKRGTLVVHGSVRLLPTFRYACTYVPSFLALYLGRVAPRYGLRRTEALEAVGLYERYTGDYAELGKGEVLVWSGR